MTAVLIILALLTLVTAAVAMTLRNLIRSALLLIASWAGIAGFYLWAGAEFVAFAQVLVYVGAVSMIVLFAVLLTRRTRADLEVAPDSVWRAVFAVLCVGAVFGLLASAVISTDLPAPASGAPTVTVKDIGLQLGGAHVPALLIAGVLLTVALLGAVVIAAIDKEDAP